MKLEHRLTGMGLVLILLLGTLSACGKPGAERTAPPEETPSVSVTPTLTPELVPTPTPEPEPSPEPVEPTYDVLSDPNVLWAVELDFHPLGESIAHNVLFAPQLEALLQQVDDDTLIAVHVAGKRSFDYFPEIPIGIMDIPEELDRDGTLTKLVTEYAHAETHEERGTIYFEIRVFLSRNPYGYASQISMEIDKFSYQIRAEVLDEWKLDPTTLSQEYEVAVIEEVNQRLSENEQYRELYLLLEAASTWDKCSELFRGQFEDVYVEEVRSLIMDYGLVSVYPSIIETPRPSLTPEYFFGTFVGTVAKIKCLEPALADSGGFIFSFASRPQS